jgi:hypothetical protein
MKRYIRAVSIIVCAAMFFSLTACKKKKKADTTETTTTTTTVTTTTAETTTTTVATTAEEEPEENLGFNNLTGEYDITEEAQGKRPVAIMINNITASLPQYGIYGADIMFEFPVEGGITRMMAVFADYTQVPKVCSVRSCRYYFAYAAASLDAVYLHWGIDKKVAQEQLDTLGIDHIDGEYNSVLFKRDTDRAKSYASEHTGYIDGSLIPSQIESSGIRSDYSDEYNNALFDFYDEYTAVSKEKCTEINVAFSTSYYSTFTYDKKTKTYKKQHNGNDQMDSVAGKQLEYTNVLVLESEDVEVINSDNGLLSVDLTGGDGYLFSGGAMKKIKWSKESETSEFKFTNEKGKALKVNTGNTYIGVTQKNMTTWE